MCRRLPSGTSVTSLEVTTPTDKGRLSVPVTVDGDVTSRFEQGNSVVVIGSVRRRVFSAGGSLGSRTEVVASRVVSRNRGTTVRKVITGASEDLLEWRDG